MKHRSLLACTLVAALAALAAACAPSPQAPATAQGLPGPATLQAPASFPAEGYLQAMAQGQQVLRIDPQRSLVRILVGRAGSLAHLGHDHVVAARSLQGFVAPTQGRADLWMALDTLTVDEEALRAAAGLDTQPSAAAIAGTRSNMLDKVLQTAQFPWVLIQVQAATPLQPHTLLSVDIELHGVRQRLQVPAQISQDEPGLRVQGQLAFAQSLFGILPFSVLGGALQVQDQVALHFDIQAAPLTPRP